MTHPAHVESENKTLYFEDLTEGMSAEISNVITDEDIVLFSQLSGDFNPVHLDEEYAAGTRFKTRIAHGSLCASFIPAVISAKLLGAGCIYVNQNLQFKAPVHIGDVVITRAVIKRRNFEKNFVDIDTKCYVDDVVVLDGEATVMVTSRPDGLQQ